MNNHKIWLTVLLVTLFILTFMAGLLPAGQGAMAAPAFQVMVTPTPPVVAHPATHLSVSAMAFMPVNPDTLYQKDAQRQILTISRQPVGIAIGSNLFVAPLVLPEPSTLTGLTVFGEDFDNQGAVQVRLKRCDHSQARCLSLAETSSTNTYAAGQFETLKAAIPNEVVNNYFYSYFLELELTAGSGSGLRAVRLEVVGRSTEDTGENVEKWALTGDVTHFLIPNQALTQVRVCTDDLSHLDNSTHYPKLVVDGQTIPLSSNACVTVLGYNMQIRRELNAGPSSGTYQILGR
ncbi:MAG: hypothetical protein JW953_05525 [Anaerolineae bacterium]|nr:hypothetical protein [Anaerolineae bacterium]